MKKSVPISLLFLFIVSILFSNPVNAQAAMASPRDSVKGHIGKTAISVNYGSPSVKGRKIWGKLVPYGKVWRAGANEATVFTCSDKIMVEGQELPAGQYSFFTIPTEKGWTIIFNKTAKQWGAFEYSDKEDALRVSVKPKKSQTLNERLCYKITEGGLVLLWENLEVPVSIKQP